MYSNFNDMNETKLKKLLKEAFDTGKEYGSNRTDKNFNDFLDANKKQWTLYGVMHLAMPRVKWLWVWSRFFTDLKH